MGPSDSRRGFSRSLATPFSVVVCLIGLLLGVLISFLSPTEWFSFAAAATLLFATTISVLVLHSKFARDAFSPLALSAVFYIFAFGAGGIYYWVSPGLFKHHYRPEDLTHGLLVANAGWLFLLGGYLVNPFRSFASLLPPFPRTPASISILWAIGPLLVVGWAARLVLFATDQYFIYAPTREAVTTGSSWFITTASLLPTLAAAFVGARSYAVSNPQSARSLRRFYRLLVAVEVVWYLPTGARASLIGLGLMIVVVSYYGRGKRMPWRSLITTSAFIAFIIFPLAFAYRNDTTAYRTNTGSALSTAATKTFGRGLDGFVGSGATATFRRLGDVTSLALISSRERNPLGGSSTTTLRWIPEAFVPRALLKTKDDPGHIGNEFGATYGLTTAGFGGTSISISQVGELYLNFGFLGLALGMPLVGAFYRFIGDYFRARTGDTAILAVYAVAAWQLVNGQETIIALGVVAVFKLMLVFALMIILTTAIQRRWATSDAPARLRETAG